MLPRFNTPNVRVINAVSLCEDGFGFVAGADRGNVSVREPSVPMFQTAIGSIFLCGIRIVFGLGANTKMGRVDARRVVANVHNHFIIGDRPNVELVRIPMSANRFFAGKKKDAVTVTVTGAFPFPTPIGLVKTALKYIVRAKQRVLAKTISFTRLVVAAATQFPRYGFFVSTLNARKLDCRLVSHKLPPTLRFYDINEVLANVV
jgi:hypothetical protein